MQNEKLSWFLVASLVLGSQLLDLYSVEGVTFWLMYQLNSFVDFTVSLMVYMLFWGLNKTPNYIFMLIYLYVLSIGIHLLGLYSELMFRLSSIEIFAGLNDLYEPTLITIFVVKMIVLGTGGYGIFNRKHRGFSSDSGDVAIAYSRDYDGPRIKTGY